MDSHGTRVATGSKDTTVAIASVTPTGLALDRVLGDCGGSQAFHEKVVKGVSLRDESTVREGKEGEALVYEDEYLRFDNWVFHLGGESCHRPERDA